MSDTARAVKKRGIVDVSVPSFRSTTIVSTLPTVPTGMRMAGPIFKIMILASSKAEDDTNGLSIVEIWPGSSVVVFSGSAVVVLSMAVTSFTAKVEFIASSVVASAQKEDAV